MMSGNLGICRSVRSMWICACWRLERYRLRTGEYPKDLRELTPSILSKLPPDRFDGQALVTKLDGEPQPRAWRSLLPKLPMDPWGHEYRYVRPGIHNPGSYDLFSSGPDGIAGNQDDEGQNWK